MKSYSFKISVSIGLLIVSFMMCFSTARAHWNKGYHYSSSACASNPDWMGDLPDNWHLSQLSIPGTHDTYSKVEHSWSAHCQMMPLSAQLQSGIRAIDIRLNSTDDQRLRTAHGVYVFWSYFEHVLNECILFLGYHEEETILMRVKQNKGYPKTFISIFRTKYMQKIYEGSTTYYERWFWHPDESEYPTNPTLGEIRGKIVLLADDPLIGLGVTDTTLYGLQYADNTMDIQDSYDMSWIRSMGWKWQGIHDQLEEARTGDPETIYINYLSGSGGVFPYFVASGHTDPSNGAGHLWVGAVGWAPHYLRARCWPFGWCYYYHGMNELTYLYLRNNRTSRVGIIMSDFPGPGLINQIILVNDFNYQMNAPIADAGGPYKTSEGSAIVFDAGNSSDPNEEPILFRWDVDSDGTWETEWSDNPTTSYTWYDNYCFHDQSSYPVIHDDTVCVAQLEVTDGIYTSGDVALVIVSNVAPTVMIDKEYLTFCIVPGQPVSFNAFFSDPGCLDTHAATWSFSDGTVLPGIVTEETDCPDTSGMVSVEHSFDNFGLFSLVVEVKDDDRGSDSDTAFVNVLTAPEAIDCTIDFIQELTNSCFKKPANQRKNALTNKLMVVRKTILADSLKSAVEKLKHDIRAKVDGSIDGHPNNDWIICEDAQRKLCMTFDGLINYLQSESNGGDPAGTYDEMAEVKSFEAEIIESAIELSWNVISDAEIKSFKIERRLAQDRLNGELTTVNLISSGERRYIDSDIDLGQSYHYTLIVMGNDDSELASESISVKTKAPDIVLYQNQPNPFNLTTQIEFEIPGDSYVELHIYNILGKQLRTLVSERLAAGRKVVAWDGTDDRGIPVASGVYFYRLSTDSYAEAKKMLLLK